MTLIALGLNHQSAPLPVREKVAFAPEAMPQALSDLARQTGVNEALILSTCNRTEVYVDVAAGAETVPKKTAERLSPLAFPVTHALVENMAPVVEHGLFPAKSVLGETVAVTLSNGYGVTQALAPTSGPPSVAAQLQSQHWETLGALRVDVLSTATALSADSKLSSTEDKWLRTYSAEQRVLGPLSITGSLSETANGGIDRSIKAGFKKTW